MSNVIGNHHADQGPDRLERERLYWQIRLISTIINNLDRFDAFDDTDIAGLTTMVSDIADKVYPEAKS